MVAGGRLLDHSPGQPGELGHVVVAPDGPQCACGRRGCLEVLASAGAISRRWAQLSGRADEGALDVFLLLGHDPVADEIWRDAVDALAGGLLTALAILGSSRVVLTGGLADAGDALLVPLRSALNRRATIEWVPDVVAGTFGTRAGIVGAALAVQDPSLLSYGAHVHRPPRTAAR